MDNDSIKKRIVTDGRDYLGNFAPKFAEINDDVLFGQVWSREKELPARDRSLITVAALMGGGITDQSLRGHLQKAKENGVTKDEMVEVVTKLAFYTGWPKAWSVFAQMMEATKIQKLINEADYAEKTFFIPNSISAIHVVHGLQQGES